MPWALELLERFKDNWAWSSLSKNYALPWSLELLEQYSDRWDWRYLDLTKLNLTFPLTTQDAEEIIEEIMMERKSWAEREVSNYLYGWY